MRLIYFFFLSCVLPSSYRLRCAFPYSSCVASYPLFIDCVAPFRVLTLRLTVVLSPALRRSVFYFLRCAFRLCYLLRCAFRSCYLLRCAFQCSSCVASFRLALRLSFFVCASCLSIAFRLRLVSIDRSSFVCFVPYFLFPFSLVCPISFSYPLPSFASLFRREWRKKSCFGNSFHGKDEKNVSSSCFLFRILSSSIWYRIVEDIMHWYGTKL